MVEAIIIKIKTKDQEVRKMFNICNIILNSNQISNSTDGTAMLLDVRKGVAYKDGSKTDIVDHHKYDVVLPNNQYEKITVKISGNALVNKEQIVQKGGSIKVKFKNLTGKLYRTSNGEYALSASADGLEVVS